MDDTDIRLGVAGIPVELLECDVLKITFTQKVQFTPGTVDLLSSKQTQIGGIDTAETLRRRIAECVHWNTLCATPVRTAYLNRIFGRVAHRYDTTAGVIVNIFLQSGRFTAFVDGTRTAYVSTAVWDEVQAMWDGLDMETREQFRSNWATNIR